MPKVLLISGEILEIPPEQIETFLSELCQNIVTGCRVADLNDGAHHSLERSSWSRM